MYCRTRVTFVPPTGDLAGLKVRHGVKEVLEDGHAIVLTLKDSSILSGDDVNEGECFLRGLRVYDKPSTNRLSAFWLCF